MQPFVTGSLQQPIQSAYRCIADVEAHFAVFPVLLQVLDNTNTAI
jgi:hypothetical protein